MAVITAWRLLLLLWTGREEEARDLVFTGLFIDDKLVGTYLKRRLLPGTRCVLMPRV